MIRLHSFDVRQGKTYTACQSSQVLKFSCPNICSCCLSMQVVGSLTAGWDDDDSTGDDNSSAGVLSHGDSQGSGGIARVDAPGGNPVYGESDVSGDGSQSILASDNSGF